MRTTKRNRSGITIQKRILRIQLYLLLVLTVLFSGISTTVLRFSMLRGADRSLDELSRYLVYQFSNHFGELEDQLEYWTTNQDLRSYLTFTNQSGAVTALPEGLERELKLAVREMELYKLSIYNEEGLILEDGRVLTVPRGERPAADTSWGLDAVPGKDGVFLTKTVPLSNFTETMTIGALRLEVETERLIRYLQDRFGVDIPYVLTGPSGEILISNIRDSRLKEQAGSSPFGPEEKESLETAAATYRGIRTDLDMPGLSLICLYDYSDSVQTSRLFLLLMMPLLLLIIVLGYLAAANMSAKIVSPLSALTASIRSAGDGKLNKPVEPGSDLEEIRVLTDSHNRMITRIHSLIEENQKTNLLRVESQLNALQQKIDPHFLFNTLELISSQALFEEAPSTRKMIQILGRLFRYNLRAPDLLELEREIAYAKDYLYLQRCRFDGALDYSVECEDGLSAVRVPKLTLQPILENAVKYGFHELGDRDNRIAIRAYSTDEGVEIQISDSGGGMDRESMDRVRASLKEDVENFGYFISRREHIGLRNVNARLCLLYKTNQSVFLGLNGPLSHTITLKIPFDSGVGSIKL